MKIHQLREVIANPRHIFSPLNIHDIFFSFSLISAILLFSQVAVVIAVHVEILLLKREHLEASQNSSFCSDNNFDDFYVLWRRY